MEHLLGEPPGSPRPLPLVRCAEFTHSPIPPPLVRFANRALRALTDERFLRAVEALDRVHRDRLDAAVDPPDEAREHVAGPDLDEGRRPAANELRGCLREADGRRELVDQERRESLRRLDLRGHGGHEGRQRLGEAHLVERGSQPIGRAGDERAVERARHLELDRSSSAEVFGLGAALLDRLMLARDHDLARAVVVRRPHAHDPPAELLDLLVLEPEDRGHRARTLASCLGHREPSLAHEPYCLACSQRPGGGKCRELADRVTDDDVGLEPALTHRSEDRQGRRDQRRLLHLGVDEILERGLEAQPLEVEARGLRADAIHLSSGRERVGDVLAHAHLERPLSGEAERDLHRSLPLSIRSEPSPR